MNPLLAEIYGTGFDKTASAEEELDLNSISAAELLYLLDQEDESEKVAEEDIDLSQLSGAELLELMEYAEEMDKEASESDLLEKMASDGSLEYFDMAGRAMAHAYADEMSKVAGEEDDLIEVDLDAISAEDLLFLMDEGYEFEKDAGLMDIPRYAIEAGKKLLGMGGKKAKETAKEKAKAEMVHQPKASAKMDAIKAKIKRYSGGEHREAARRNISEGLRERRTAKSEINASARQGMEDRSKRKLRRGAGQAAIGYGAPAAAVAVPTTGAVVMSRRKKRQNQSN